MDTKKEALILVVALVYSVASISALSTERNFIYVTALVPSLALGLASAIFLLVIIGRFIIDKVRKEKRLKESEHLFEGVSPKAAALTVGGIILTTIAFLDPPGILSLFPVFGMLAFIYGFYRVFPIPWVGGLDTYDV